MEFFRKYQRVILYTAGIFALVSFSISGAVLGFFDDVFRGKIPVPTMLVDGKEVEVTLEDDQVARIMVQRGGARGDPANVIPPLGLAGVDDNMRDVYAALRRRAIEAGIDVSMNEVDRAILQAVTVLPMYENPTQLALGMGYPSLQAYRASVAEAMRIGTFLRLQAFATDTSDASLVEDILEEEKKVTLRVASLDKETLEEELKQADVTDEDLREWIDELEESDKEMLGLVDQNRVILDIAYLELPAFDEAQFSAELEGKEFSDEEVEGYYNLNKTRLYKVPAPEKDDEKEDAKGDEKETDKENGDSDPEDNGSQQEEAQGEAQGEAQEEAQGEAGDPEADQVPIKAQQPDEYLPLDEALKTEIRKRLLAEDVMRSIWQKVQNALFAHIQPLVDARTDALQAKSDAEKARDEATAKAEAPGAGQEAVDEAEAAETAFTEAEAAFEAAEQAVADARKGFDMRAAFREQIGERAGFGFTSTGPELKESADLRDLGELGTWDGNWVVNGMTEVGDLSTQVQSTKDHVFEFQLADLDEKPLKEFDEIREKARGDYFTRRADELAKEKAEDFEAALLDLAKLEIADKVTELEAKKAEDLEEKFTGWKTDLEKAIAEAIAERDRQAARAPGSRVHKDTVKRVEGLEQELAEADAKREELQKELDESTEAEIVAEAKKVYKDVLDEAAAQAGFAVSDVGPYSRSLRSRGGPRERFPEDVQYLFLSSEACNLDEGEVSELLEDMTNRAYYLAVSTKVEDATIEDLTRKQLLQRRASARGQRMRDAILQSFTLEGIEKRYGWRSPNAEPVTEPAAQK